VQVKDSLIWGGTLNGEFSVRSTYHMEKDLQTLWRSESSRQSAGTTIWKTIWSLKISNASKMFIWKACNDLLPTKMNLLKCGVVSDALCPICTRDDETVNHILWSCPSGQDVWRCGPKKLQKGMNGVHNFFFTFLKPLWSVVT